MITTKAIAKTPIKSALSCRPRGRPVKGSEMAVVQDIVTAAQTLFFQNGYERTSIDQVAALAKSSKRTVYSKFATKAELFDAVVRRFIGEKQAIADPYVLSGTTLRERLMNMAEKSVEGFLQDDVRALYFLVHREADMFPELVRIVEEAGRKPAQRRIMNLLAEGGIEGDHSFLAEQFSSLLYWPLTRRVIAGDTDVTEEVLASARASVDFFLRGCGYTDL
ncbi:TetR/AcrR family transcriptional regulator [Agrobacterium sp. Azo12]|uniref:TetR/AcrR family transcriptional regulator n=1 Tax=Agrobacterium sp. Azo12 TaxID=3031129 RepID=UPI0023D8B801|nr:TetR/AcrR family transcriptional regulator [Agrobacterium sp. Azo12]MDO5898437.1 TetR/AcrR family transcriptional regulator [Agrobacterium sp. Azo12]